MTVSCSLHKFSLVEEQLGLHLQSVIMLCCVLTQGLCWAQFTPTHTALLSALHVSWSWGVRKTYIPAMLKSETLTASVRFNPVSVDCNS